jgi:protein-S-isoprenylcysteine O-methyltransferase Ste14
MNKQKKLSKITWIFRLLLIFLSIIPFLFWQPFYEHFYTYLTGTVINGIIKSQWHLVVFFILLFTVFAVPLTYRKRAKWIDYSLISAFFISLFIEMYGIPLTLLFASKYLFTPEAVLPANVIEFYFLGVGIGMDHAMLYGSILMIMGMALILFGWWSLYSQSKHPGFACSGFYKYSRHPQYLGFILLIIGWFFGWPTILTLFFSPILIYKYIRAAKEEEKDMILNFGQNYLDYKENTPFLI